jgi:hypothetical protein
MNNRHELRLDLAHARQRELLAAGERARMGRAQPSGDERAVATRSGTAEHRSGSARRAVLIGLLMIRRARLSAVREQGPC